MGDRSEAQQFWDREVVAPTHASWMADPQIRDYINAAIGGSSPRWPIDWFHEWLGTRRFPRALSIGCGTGALERDLVKRGLCDHVDAFDGSIVSLHVARSEADREGLSDRINYFAMDFNEPALPRKKYDAIFFHQSAHHVAKLEKLYRAILRAIKRDGMLYLDEYVGPSRHEWTAEALTDHQRIFDRLPENARVRNDVPLPIQMDDPSEAIRSSEILPQLAVGFDVVTTRPYGGTLLSVLYPLLRAGEITPEMMDGLLAEERRLLAAGATSYYTIVVARPKRGIGKLAASINYYAVPKLKRLAREIRARLRKES